MAPLSASSCRSQMKDLPKILLIEDDPAIVTSLEEILTADGYAVSLAKRGDEGLALAQSSSFWKP